MHVNDGLIMSTKNSFNGATAAQFNPNNAQAELCHEDGFASTDRNSFGAATPRPLHQRALQKQYHLPTTVSLKTLRSLKNQKSRV